MKRWYVGDVMTREVISVPADLGYKAVADLLVRYSISAVPVVDGERRVLGVVSEADLLARLEYSDRVPRHPLSTRWMRAGGRTGCGDRAGDLMTAPAVTIAETETVTRAARLMGAARVKRIPVVDGDGRLVGIVSRRDLVSIYTRPDSQIRAAVIDGVIRPLWIDPDTVDVRVRGGVVTLSGLLERHSTAAILLSLTEATPGVVDVVDRLRYEVDDAQPKAAPLAA
jgi:CBS-domain-containing membrane protein